MYNSAVVGPLSWQYVWKTVGGIGNILQGCKVHQAWQSLSQISGLIKGWRANGPDDGSVWSHTRPDPSYLPPRHVGWFRFNGTFSTKRLYHVWHNSKL